MPVRLFAYRGISKPIFRTSGLEGQPASGAMPIALARPRGLSLFGVARVHRRGAEFTGPLHGLADTADVVVCQALALGRARQRGENESVRTDVADDFNDELRRAALHDVQVMGVLQIQQLSQAPF